MKNTTAIPLTAALLAFLPMAAMAQQGPDLGLLHEEYVSSFDSACTFTQGTHFTCADIENGGCAYTAEGVLGSHGQITLTGPTAGFDCEPAAGPVTVKLWDGAISGHLTTSNFTAEVTNDGLGPQNGGCWSSVTGNVTLAGLPEAEGSHLAGTPKFSSFLFDLNLTAAWEASAGADCAPASTD